MICSILILSYSWVKIVAIVAILVPGIIWLVTHGQLKKIFKYIVIAVLIFAISFTSFESYLLWNAGYPSTNVTSEPGVTITFPALLNISLNQLIQSIEKSPTYALLTIEHGDAIPEAIQLDSGFPGGFIEVDFYAPDSNTFFSFMASSGYQFHATASSISGPLSSLYASSLYTQSSPKEDFGQIDALGHQWFYNYALEYAQNKTGSTPKIDALSVTMNFEGYEGITLMLIGSFTGAGRSTLIADFESNGTLMYMTQPE